jgi:phospholipase/carboxylesterase
MERDPHAAAPVLHAGPALEKSAACVILLHGRGATAESILDLAHVLDRPECTFLAPQAANVGYGPAWYPHSFLAPLAENEPWLSSALAMVGGLLDRVERLGVSTQQIVLAGFSQGACLATEFAARNARRYGGVVGLSGGLIGNGDRPGVDPPADKLFVYDGDLAGTPVFLGCSDRDAHIPVDRVHTTAEVLSAMAGAVDIRIYEGMGHTVNDDELEAFRGLLDHMA